ncbi:MAG TPA: hypothetical protein VKS62_09510, partial [Methylomirabilota bacterium]|nr:hypothetical protein [Methylomirabilota bacterium]
MRALPDAAHKIRLLRKAGRAGEAQALTMDCALNGTTELKRARQEANQTPAALAATASGWSAGEVEEHRGVVARGAAVAAA